MAILNQSLYQNNKLLVINKICQNYIFFDLQKRRVVFKNKVLMKN